MNFNVFGGFEIERDEDRGLVYDRNEFWGRVNEAKVGLSDACGCYLFAMRHGSNIKPWYVGKAERQKFRSECFSPSKQKIYSDVFNSKRGTGLLFLLPKLTLNDNFSSPTRKRYDDVEFLETLLIGMALTENPDLCNIQKTNLRRKIRVPGVVNSSPGASTKPVRELRNALGLLSKSA